MQSWWGGSHHVSGTRWSGPTPLNMRRAPGSHRPRGQWDSDPLDLFSKVGRRLWRCYWRAVPLQCLAEHRRSFERESVAKIVGSRRQRQRMSVAEIDSNVLVNRFRAGRDLSVGATGNSPKPVNRLNRRRGTSTGTRAIDPRPLELSNEALHNSPNPAATLATLKSRQVPRSIRP